VILGSIPLAIFGGIVRLSTIFLSVHYISPVMGDRQPHIYLSWAVFLILLLIVIGIDQYLSKNKTE
jgi:exosortase/archaeosortase family protein